MTNPRPAEGSDLPSPGLEIAAAALSLKQLPAHVNVAGSRRSACHAGRQGQIQARCSLCCLLVGQAAAASRQAAKLR